MRIAIRVKVGVMIKDVKHLVFIIRANAAVLSKCKFF